MLVRKNRVKTIPVTNQVGLQILGENTEVVKKVSIIEREDVVQVNRSGTPYLIFHFDALSKKYGLSIFDIMTVLYLRELNQFKRTLRINGSRITVGFLEEEGFIEKDFSAGQNIYTLSKLGKSLFSDFNKAIENDAIYFSDNREMGMDVDSDLEDVLNSYF